MSDLEFEVNDKTYNTKPGETVSTWASRSTSDPDEFRVEKNNFNTRDESLVRPAYGYSVSYSTKFRMFSYGDGYYSISPVGINPTTINLDLSYEGLDKDSLENIISFAEATKGEYFTFLPPAPFCKRNTFRIDSYNTTFGNNHSNVSMTLIGTQQSALNLNKNAGATSEYTPPDESSTMYLGEASDFTGNYTQASSEPISYEDYKTTGYIDRVTRINNGSTEPLLATSSDSYESFQMMLQGWYASKYYEKDTVISLRHNSTDPKEVGYSKYYYCTESHVSSSFSTDYSAGKWVKHFAWEPSEQSSAVGQSRIMSSEFSEGRTEIISDGRNANPLLLNLTFSNRSDREAYAILHFLESKKGYTRFKVSSETIPRPYKMGSTLTERYFICGQWSFTKNYLENNTITATFVEDPLGIDLESSSYDSSFTSQPT